MVVMSGPITAACVSAEIAFQDTENWPSEASSEMDEREYTTYGLKLVQTYGRI